MKFFTFFFRKKKTRYSIKTSADKSLSAYDVIASCLNLKKIEDNIYVDEKNEKFVRTKYGFEPATRYNLKITNISMQNKLEKLVSEFNYLKGIQNNLYMRIENIHKQHKNQVNSMISDNEKRLLNNPHLIETKKQYEVLQQRFIKLQLKVKKNQSNTIANTSNSEKLATLKYELLIKELQEEIAQLKSINRKTEP
jgi:hypothetical protein